MGKIWELSVKTTHMHCSVWYVCGLVGASLKVETLTFFPPSVPLAGGAFSGRPGRGGEAAYKGYL